MFITLLIATFILALVVSFILAKIFRPIIARILDRIMSDEIYDSWVKYLIFALYVVGISSGVRVWDLEKYINPAKEGAEILVLNSGRWILEIYRTIIGTLQGAAWMLLVFFMIALIAFVIVRMAEMRRVNK